MNEENMKFNFSLEETQLLYYLLNKECLLTERNVSARIKDSKTDLETYNDLLHRKKISEKLKRKIGKTYGEINA
jgi:hypothetical protein|tara:strand:+ start:369 stop:590 length:222 start_codon:yes stop_codon:yes gene_type:complete